MEEKVLLENAEPESTRSVNKCQWRCFSERKATRITREWKKALVAVYISQNQDVESNIRDMMADYGDICNILYSANNCIYFGSLSIYCASFV